MPSHLQAIDRLVQGIIQEVHPLRIILFGSLARSQATPNSDIDLLVVMPEGVHRRHTEQRLYQNLRGIGVPYDIIVATPSDLETHKNHLGLIYKTILQEGRELYATLRETLCFHAQQAVEKSLKAVLIANTIEFPRTHNLEVLFDLLPQDLSVPETVRAAVSLTQHAVSSRYPREIEPVEEAEYQEAIQLAKTLVSWVENLIRPEQMMTASGLAEVGLLNETLSEDASSPRG